MSENNDNLIDDILNQIKTRQTQQPETKTGAYDIDDILNEIGIKTEKAEKPVIKPQEQAMPVINNNTENIFLQNKDNTAQPADNTKQDLQNKKYTVVPTKKMPEQKAERQQDTQADYMQMLQNKLLQKDAVKAEQAKDSVYNHIDTKKGEKTFKQDPEVLNYFTTANEDELLQNGDELYETPIIPPIQNAPDAPNKEEDVKIWSKEEKKPDVAPKTEAPVKTITFEKLSGGNSGAESGNEILTSENTLDEDINENIDEEFTLKEPVQMQQSQNDTPSQELKEDSTFGDTPLEPDMTPVKDEDFVLPIDISSISHANGKKQDTFSDFHLTSGVERDEFEKFFSNGIMLDDEPQQQKRQRKANKKARRPKSDLTGTSEFIISQESINQDDTNEIEFADDYNTQADAQNVMHHLKKMRAWFIFRTIAVGLIGLGVLYIGLTAQTTIGISQGSNTFLSLAIAAQMLLFAMLLCIGPVTKGLGGIFGKPTADTVSSVAAVAAIIQAVVYMFRVEEYNSQPVTIFAAVAILGLFFNSLGRFMYCNVTIRNFKMSIAEVEYSAAYMVKNMQLARRVTEGMAESEPQLLVSRQTGLVKGFLRHSFSERLSDKRSKALGIAVLLVSLICGAVCFVTTKDIGLAATAFAAAACVGAPFTSTLVSAVPSILMQSAAGRVGAVIPGWSAIEELGRANVVIATAEDLFPEGQVKLCGIKTFEKERVDLAILYAASIIVEGCSTMRSVFLPVIEGNVAMLYTVENMVKETGCGIMGWIDHNRVIIGNRAMMAKHDIDIPSMDYEQRYTKDGKKPMYLAVSGKLFGMFLLKYTFNEQVAENLDNLQSSGISMLIKSDDFIITAAMIEEIYDLQSGSVKIMSAKDEELLKPNLEYMPESEGAMTHIGSFASFLGGLHAAASAAMAEKVANIIQICGAVIGMIIVVLLTITQGIISLNLPAVILFLVAWTLLTVAIPLLKKY